MLKKYNNGFTIINVQAIDQFMMISVVRLA